MGVVDVEHLTTKRGVKLILNDVSFSIDEGEHTTLFGLNGSGKTTLLATLCGYMGYSSGSIRVLGRPVTPETAQEVRRGISFVSNSYFNRLYHKETSFNIVLGGAFGELSERWGVTREHILRAKHLLNCFGMKEKGMYPYDMLSYGQQQRVLIARGLMVPPKLLVLDEPTSGLDVLTREYLMNTVRSIADENGTTILCATHYSEEIMPMYKRGILMRAGRIFADGKLEDVFTSSVLSEFFEEGTTASFKDGVLQFGIAKQYGIPRSLWA